MYLFCSLFTLKDICHAMCRQCGMCQGNTGSRVRLSGRVGKALLSSPPELSPAPSLSLSPRPVFRKEVLSFSLNPYLYVILLPFAK